MRSKEQSRRAAPTSILLAGVIALALGAIAQEPETGRELYTANGCFQCHGYAGQGSIAGPRIAPSPYPYIAFAQLVRRPADVMPAYAGTVLGDNDLREIYEYVRTMQEPPALSDIAILR